MAKILIIEADTNLRINLTELFELENHHVYAVQNCHDARRVALEYQPNLVVANILTLYTNKSAAIKTLRNKTFSQIPVIFLAAPETEDFLSELVKDQQDRIVAVPFNVEKLFSTSQQLLLAQQIAKTTI